MNTPHGMAPVAEAVRNISTNFGLDLGSERVQGMPLDAAEALFERFLEMMTAPVEAPVADLGALSAFAGVRRFPVRVKCATLPWQALRAAAAASGDVVSTE